MFFHTVAVSKYLLLMKFKWFIIGDCIALPLTLLSLSCLSYRQFTGGAGEMNYCILYPEDDDMEFAFDKSEDNYPRYDSTAYLLGPPFYHY